MPKDTLKVRGDFLPRKRLMSDAEIDRLVRAFVELGVTKIRITGGEPLLRPGLESLIERLAAITGVEDLALITNGVLLPRMAKDLAQAGLGRITVSLDSLDEEVFARMSGSRSCCRTNRIQRAENQYRGPARCE
jgi:cyclic pyranopterin phosphate synthase